MPWFSKNSAMKLAGKLHICSGSADQTARGLGDDQPLDEVPGEALLLEPVAERGRGPVHPDQRPRLAVEAAPVAQHAEEAWG